MKSLELLEKVNPEPETAAITLVTFSEPKRDSGFPARIFAIVP